MKYNLFILPRAQKQLAKLDPSHLAAIKTKISALEDIPRPAGCKKLRGREGWRIRIGDHRVIYEIDDSDKIVTVIKVGHRSEIYA